ncbi:DUF6735 family protein [Haladaptatus sp. DFWS20]|uniref:DUF6735 family protein n=1 Tax=Haladaptatus sp. DFWS20 TaxID=3403467 RepID=UPI003EB82288
MRHRALVAYERPDGRYDRHYAHWGATSLSLRHKITPETPFAGGIENRWTPAIEPLPQATALPFEDTATFDYQQIEAFYVVSLAWVVTVYLPLWFGTTVEADPTVGALVAVSEDQDANHVRQWFQATRAVVRDMVRRGALSEREATNYLATRVPEWAGDRREVILIR